MGGRLTAALHCTAHTHAAGGVRHRTTGPLRIRTHPHRHSRHRHRCCTSLTHDLPAHAHPSIRHDWLDGRSCERTRRRRKTKKKPKRLTADYCCVTRRSTNVAIPLLSFRPDSVCVSHSSTFMCRCMLVPSALLIMWPLHAHNGATDRCSSSTQRTLQQQRTHHTHDQQHTPTHSR